MNKNSNNKHMFSFFKEPVTNTSPEKIISLAQCYKAISGNYLQKTTSELRKLSCKDEKRKFKANRFPFVTFSGTFKHRSESGLIKHSGLMVLDFDNLELIRTLKIKLLLDKYLEPVLLFTSPSGTGLKAVLKIDMLQTLTHRKIFEAIKIYIKKTYQVEVDPSGRDVCRVCFLCHDPEAIIHPAHGRMIFDLPDKVWQIEKQKFDVKKWLKPKPKKKHEQTSRTAPKINGQSNDVETVLSRIEAARIDLTSSYQDWIKLGFSFSSEFGLLGRDYFHRVSRFHPEYNSEKTDQQFDKCLKGLKTSSIKVFFAAARDAGINIYTN